MTRRNSPAAKVLALVGVLVMTPVTAPAKDRQFSGIVQRIQSHYQKRPMRFMGVLSFVASRFHPEGIKNINLAIFEGLDSSRRPTDPDFDAFMQNIAGPEFRPFVRVRSRREGEQTFVYGKESGKDFELLIISLEREETCVVKLRVNPEEMEKWIDDPAAMSRSSGVRPNRGASR